MVQAFPSGWSRLFVGSLVGTRDDPRMRRCTCGVGGTAAIHLRTFSTDNAVSGNIVHDTGMKNETYGEGLYVGSANSNWGTYTGVQPDASDRNR